MGIQNLHKKNKVIHGNISLDSIYIDDVLFIYLQGFNWKIGNFDLSFIKGEYPTDLVYK